MLSINNTHIFLFGNSLAFNSTLKSSFIYNTVSEKWISLHSNQSHIPCQSEKGYKFSSAILRPQNVIIVAVNNCTAALNLTSFVWMEFPLPMPTGVTFNIDTDEKIVLYISSQDDQASSHIYWVILLFSV